MINKLRVANLETTPNCFVLMTTPETPKVCPVRHSDEVPDTHEHLLARNSPHYSAMVKKKTDSNDPNDMIPGIEIPSTGRGNSESGATWLNPSANQLYNSLKRKNKPIDYSDAASVATVHAIVTEQTWNAILEYENLHSHKCQNIKLARFEGKDGIYSPKARFFHRFLGMPLPYDRHDWTVDRCGKEICYVIDYYAIPVGISPTYNSNDQKNNDENNKNNQNNQNYANSQNNNENNNNNMIDDDAIEFEYTIDARPKLNSFGNAWDRIRVSFTNWRKGESWY